MNYLFDDAVKLQIVQEALKAMGKKGKVVFIEDYDTNCAIVTTSCDAMLLVEFYVPHTDAIAVQAIHLIKDQSKGFTYRNGKAGANLQQLVFLGKKAPITWATRAQFGLGGVN